ncbi:MAG TPA: hypothetical protein DGH68_04845 [Bacteroidetes bacterium]|nr:hypothetical protein [Bacteroidota bacterium]
MMTKLVLALVCCVTIGFAHNSYTGGYSGAPGRSRCASSCHGGTSGTLTVTGFPTTYQPLQTYTIIVRHNGGNRIVNFNATTHVGATTTVAGTFTAGLNSILYTGADGGVYASPHLIDSAIFQWTAPAAGAGTVNFYAAAFQGTSTSSSSGTSGVVTFTAPEITTGVGNQPSSPEEFRLDQNYPNPFNPTTQIAFQLPSDANVSVKVYDLIGNEVTTLVNGRMKSGTHELTFNASGLPSGIYFYQVITPTFTQTRKMVLAK